MQEVNFRDLFLRNDADINLVHCTTKKSVGLGWNKHFSPLRIISIVFYKEFVFLKVNGDEAVLTLFMQIFTFS